MIVRDGHRIVETSDRRMEGQTVSRWEELQQAVLYHAELAADLGLASDFRLLNEPGRGLPREFSVGTGSAEELRIVRNVLQLSQPIGVTPLAEHLRFVENFVRGQHLQLRTAGKRVVVVIATDGLPTDAIGNEGEDVLGEFVGVLKSMEDLPVWLVIRLCTDEKKVCDFYNSLDGLLELSLEVLDDHIGEAREVTKYNRWLNYGMPLHRLRELGYTNRLFDMIDERKLTHTELKEFCVLLFGSHPDEIPDPVGYWKDFVRYVEKEIQLHEQQWDPIKKKMAPWIDVKALNRCYTKQGWKKAFGM